LMRNLQTLFEQSWNYLNFQHRKINVSDIWVYIWSFQYFVLSGIEVTSGAASRVCHPVLLLAAADLPARALITCLKQCDGRNSCLYCYQEGTSVSGQICWPFEEVPVKRTRKSLIEDAKKANEQNTSVCSNTVDTVFGMLNTMFF
jgi:hypothetical protein